MGTLWQKMQQRSEQRREWSAVEEDPVGSTVTLQRQLRALEMRCDALDRECSDAQDLIEALRGEVRILQATASQVAWLRDRVDDLGEQVSALTDAVDDL